MSLVSLVCKRIRELKRQEINKINNELKKIKLPEEIKRALETEDLEQAFINGELTLYPFLLNVKNRIYVATTIISSNDEELFNRFLIEHKPTEEEILHMIEIAVYYNSFLLRTLVHEPNEERYNRFLYSSLLYRNKDFVEEAVNLLKSSSFGVKQEVLEQALFERRFDVVNNLFHKVEIRDNDKLFRISVMSIRLDGKELKDEDFKLLDKFFIPSFTLEDNYLDRDCVYIITQFFWRKRRKHEITKEKLEEFLFSIFFHVYEKSVNYLLQKIEYNWRTILELSLARGLCNIATEELIQHGDELTPEMQEEFILQFIDAVISYEPSMVDVLVAMRINVEYIITRSLELEKTSSFIRVLEVSDFNVVKAIEYVERLGTSLPIELYESLLHFLSRPSLLRRKILSKEKERINKFFEELAVKFQEKLNKTKEEDLEFSFFEELEMRNIRQLLNDIREFLSDKEVTFEFYQRFS